MDKRDPRKNTTSGSQHPSAFIVEDGKGKEFLKRFNQSKEKNADFWKEIREIKHQDKQKEKKNRL